LKMGFLMGKAGFRPSDICVSAPTGSGKTLAFVLPIIQVIIFNTVFIWSKNRIIYPSFLVM
jgi:superfamily II DNA/RNA helicase